MDTKEGWLIEQLHGTLVFGSFSERGVLSLLILLRRHAARGSPVREFGDFVAHRGKDRGVLKEYLRRVELALRGEEERGERLVTLPVFTVKDIRSSFNTLFHSLSLAEMNPELGNQVTVCIISLLQSVEIETGQLVPLRGFAIGISSEHIGLLGHGAVPAGHLLDFPMLLARNRYQRIDNMPIFMRLDFVVEAYCVNGHFSLEQRPRAA